MSDVFLREFEFPADFPGQSKVLEFEVCDPQAAVCHVTLRRENYIDDQNWSQSKYFFRLTVRDRGSPTKHSTTKAVVVLRRLNELIPLSDDCGKLLGFLRSDYGRDEYYVFEARRAPTATGSTASETTLSRPAKEHAIGCHLRDVVACSCVFDGPSAHASPPASPTSSGADTGSWWEFPGEPKASEA